MDYEVSFVKDIAQRRTSFEISSVYCLEKLGKYFSLNVTPEGDVTSIQVLQYLL